MLKITGAVRETPARQGRFWGSLLLLALLAGCKVEVLVPPGGKVITASGAYDCAAGQTCTLNIYDTYFDENFIAVPDSGYEFTGWKKGNGYFCGGNRTSCPLTTRGFPGNNNLMAVLESDTVFRLQPVFRRVSQGPVRQSYQLSADFPSAFIRDNYDRDLFITSMSGGDGGWNVFMSQVSGFTSQRYFSGSTFPGDNIQVAWNQDQSITEVAAHNGIWVVTATGGTGLGAQFWKTSATFPESSIEERWNSGYSITDMAYKNGTWALVMSRVERFGGQAYKLSNAFPADFMNNYGNRGYRVTEVAYGGGQWLVVMTDLNGATGEYWQIDTGFPEAEIQRQWNAYRDVTALVPGNGQFVLVASSSLAANFGGTGNTNGGGNGGGGNGGGGDGTSALTINITDACNDGRPLDYRFFDKTNNLVWPNSSQYYYTSGYYSTDSHTLSCRTGAQICYGAETDNWYWGVGLDGDRGCEDCCVTCQTTEFNVNPGC
ncbi:DUF7477 domain-containing protein [Parahaliea aestuarii]|uniref:DUF7477 domain-containing protein n=1 Tax=Parahaliea aestuarii TaxID=1852021 RepID=A0A5C9A2B0_9GAMM|nr:hypothetical protein [Parahaliea aestuarii]TXS94856.1 hypothetical protein FVW59_02810 [Parahaliea aestuarii]